MTNIEVPAHFDDVAAGLAAGREAELVLLRQASVNESFVATGVKAANTLLRMAGIMDSLFKGIKLHRSENPALEFCRGKMLIYGEHKLSTTDGNVAFYGIGTKIIPKKEKVLISYKVIPEFFDYGGMGPWYRFHRMKPEPAFEKLEEIYKGAGTLGLREEVLSFYRHFLSFPGEVYNWIEGLKREQEAKNRMIVSQPEIQSQIISNGLREMGDLEQKLKVLVPDPLEEKFRQLEGR